MTARQDLLVVGDLWFIMLWMKKPKDPSKWRY